MLLLSMLTTHSDTVKKGEKRGLTQWQQWLIILTACHMIRVIKLHQRKKCVQCIIKIMILKITLTIYSKQWKKEVSSYSTTCHGCLKTVTKEHNAKTCSSGRSCKVCNEKHVTILHGYLSRDLSKQFY